MYHKRGDYTLWHDIQIKYCPLHNIVKWITSVPNKLTEFVGCFVPRWNSGGRGVPLISDSSSSRMFTTAFTSRYHNCNKTKRSGGLDTCVIFPSIRTPPRHLIFDGRALFGIDIKVLPNDHASVNLSSYANFIEFIEVRAWGQASTTSKTLFYHFCLWLSTKTLFY